MTVEESVKRSAFHLFSQCLLERHVAERYDNEVDRSIVHKQLYATRIVTALLSNVLQKQQCTNRVQSQRLIRLKAAITS